MMMLDTIWLKDYIDLNMEKAGPVQLGIANLIQLTTYILHVFA
jgi:hypothetical protein